MIRDAEQGILSHLEKMDKNELIAWLLQGDVSIQYQVYRDLLAAERHDLQDRIANEGWGVQFLSRCGILRALAYFQYAGRKWGERMVEYSKGITGFEAFRNSEPRSLKTPS